MVPAEITLIRHGNTASNGLHDNPVMSGWSDLPLSDIGRSQLKCLRERLLDAAPFDAAYSSPLRRAMDTALAVSSACGILVNTLNDLRELNCGTVDGMPIERVRTQYAKEWDENARQENPDFRWPEGESYRELRSRSIRALDEIAKEYPGGRVLVVTHCGVITQLLGSILGASPARWESNRAENASITEVLWCRSHGTLVRFNDTSHLSNAACRTT